MTTTRLLSKILLVNSMAVALCASASAATIYTDPIDDLHDGTGGGSDMTPFQILNISEMEVSNNASHVSFKFTLAGDILATNWGKYLVGISTDTAGSGDTASNGWGRPISMSSAGMDYFIGSWVDSGNGAEVYSWDGAAWNVEHATYNSPPNDDISISTSQYTAEISVPLATLGVGPGDMIWFDAFTTGGGGTDSAIDALSSSVASITDWGNAFDSPGDVGLLKYVVVAVPEPGVASLVWGVALLLPRRRKS